MIAWAPTHEKSAPISLMAVNTAVDRSTIAPEPEGHEHHLRVEPDGVARHGDQCRPTTERQRPTDHEHHAGPGMMMIANDTAANAASE